MKLLQILFINILINFFLFMPTFNTFGQLSRIAIINHVDSTLIHVHIGTTIFTNKTDTFKCNFNCRTYIENELPRFLSSKYTVSLINTPDSITSKNGSIYNFLGINKSAKSWIESLKDQYDFIIYVESSGANISDKTILSSGIYSRGFSFYIYSTIYFTALKPGDFKKLDYKSDGMKFYKDVKDHNLFKKKAVVDPDIFPFVRSELIKLIDYKLEYFLTHSYLLPKDSYDKIKALKTEY